jgi:hypothetical protein
MAAPADTRRVAYGFRDARGRTARLTVIIGAATPALIETDAATLLGHLAAITNAHVYEVDDPAPVNHHTYGGAANYLDVEDKAVLTWTDPVGNTHRYKVPAPITAIFLANQNTVNPANAAMVSLISDFETFVYGNYDDLAPLFFVGGIRGRTKVQRKLNIWIKDPTLAEPAE